MKKIKNIFHFGEKMDKFEVRVLNEREIRAGAGILFLFAFTVFFYAFVLGNFYPIKIYVIIFSIEFIIRVLINPKYAPSLILGRIIVSNQVPEYIGAPQKRFAWSIGLILVIIMFFGLVVFNLIGPWNIIICLLCLVFLFFESVFGICLGCKMYNFIHKDKAQLCPGGTCEAHSKDEIQKVNWIQIIILSLVLSLSVFLLFSGVISKKDELKTINSKSVCDQEVPEWAKAIGHEKLYRIHNGCEDEVVEKDVDSQELMNFSAVSPDIFKKLYENGEYLALDVRTPKEIAQGKVIGDALEIDFYDENFVDKLKKLDKNKKYLVNCFSGGRSGKTVGIMKKLGFEEVYDLEGGIKAWKKAGYEEL